MSLTQNPQRNFFSDKFVIWSIHVDLSCVLFLVTNGQYVLRPLQDSLLFSSLLFSSLLFSSLLFSSLLFSSLLFSSLLFSSLLFSSLLFSSLLFSSLLFSSLLFSSLLFSSLLFSILYSFVQSNAGGGGGGFTRTKLIKFAWSTTFQRPTTFPQLFKFSQIFILSRIIYVLVTVRLTSVFLGGGLEPGGRPSPEPNSENRGSCYKLGNLCKDSE